jgi:hypothetical protein
MAGFVNSTPDAWRFPVSSCGSASVPRFSKGHRPPGVGLRIKKVRGRMTPHTLCSTDLCREDVALSLLRRRLVPDAPLTGFRHQEQAEHESDRRNGNRVDQRVTGNARTAKPPVMDQNRRLCLIASNNATLRTRRSKRHRMGVVEPATASATQ